MGASLSSNVSKIVVDSIAKVTAESLNNNAITTSQTAIISATGVEGDVNISGNTTKQRVNVNVKALFDNLNSASIQQKLAAELGQRAKALTSGFNTGQMAGVTNFIAALISETLSVTSNLTNTCGVKTDQVAKIVVTKAGGNVAITDNEVVQIADIIESCVAKAVTNSAGIQSSLTKIKQAGEATAAGLSEWALGLIAALVVGAPVVGGVVGGVMVLKYIFPVLLIAGILMIAAHIYYTKPAMKYVPFSTLIDTNATCDPKESYATGSQANIADTAAKCLADAECVGADFNKFTVTSTGAMTARSEPVTKFYNKVSCNTVPADRASVIRTPAVTTGSTATPAGGTPQAGDMYIQLSGSAPLYQAQESTGTSTKWVLIGNLIPSARAASTSVKKLATAPTAAPDADADGTEAYMLVIPNTNASITVYYYNRSIATPAWQEVAKRYIPTSVPKVPAETNVSMFKVYERNPMLLYLGIGSALIGLGGTIYTMVGTSSSTAQES